MVKTLLARLKASRREGERSDHVSILLPFLIISVGLGVLAVRSYQLSARMERGANVLASQYAGYAADITARRVDTALRGEMFTASEEWQQTERRSVMPTFGALQDWLNRNNWIVSAIYVPDSDPADSIYVSERDSGQAGATRLTREFYTSSGTVRYSYDPGRLLTRVSSVLSEQPLAGTNPFPQQTALKIVSTPKHQGLSKTPQGFAFTSALGAPLADYSIRAFVATTYAGSGWENHRVISLWLSFLALALTTLGAYLALRGLRKEAETMKLRGALIANVSHELRTPLSMIRLGAETLKRSTKLTEKQRQEIEESILREVVHLSHLVENVLDIARIQHQSAKALAFTPVYPRELVTTLVSTYESWIRNKGFEITLRVDEPIAEQFWDREAVSRAVLNLIDNAIKYSADTKSIEVTLGQTAENVIIEVTDHGIGIAPKDQTRIFDPYYRAQFSDTQTRRGAGLGLTLVQQIVASHGGTIEVDSAPGTGSTFRMILPQAHTATEPRAARFAPASGAF